MWLTSKDIQIIYDCSRPTAVQRCKEIAKYFRIPSGRVTPYHVANYEALNVNEIIDRLFKTVKKCKSGVLA